MSPAIKSVADQTSSLWAQLPVRRRVIVAGALGITLLGLAWLVLSDRSPKHAVLFSGLTPADAGEIVRQLEAQTEPAAEPQRGAPWPVKRR